MRRAVFGLITIALLLSLTACRVTVERQFCPIVSETPPIESIPAGE